MASKGIRHCIRKKRTRKGLRCAEYAPGSGGMFWGDDGATDMGAMDVGNIAGMGYVAKRKYIPGKGVRCWDHRGKFTSCLGDSGMGAPGDGDMGVAGGTGALGAPRKRRKSTKRRSIKGRGVRCRRADGRFTRCR